MQLSKRHIFGLRVYTTSRFFLGRVCDITLETGSQSIVQYHVHPSLAVMMMTHMKVVRSSSLLIHRDQVERMTNTEMVVRDGVRALIEESVRLQHKAAEQAVAQPATMNGTWMR